MANDSLPLNEFTALSPLDGRYHRSSAQLRQYFSEFALMRARVHVEVEWLIHLSEQSAIAEVPAFSPREKTFLREMASGFSVPHARRVKAIEKTTNHDVKAIEYFLKERICRVQAPAGLASVCEFIHFACTSEDINNLAYALLLKHARDQLIVPPMRVLLTQLYDLANTHCAQPMLARTHGQPASPTTMGKEFANFAHRLKGSIETIATQPIYGKFNGATGNFNAHFAAYPQLDWPHIANVFVSNLGVEYQPLSTQIEPHDYLAELCHSLCRVNTILIDLDRDVWGYIAWGYFRQRTNPGEVGSSAMPHKVNPIDFENSEGNLGIANALLQHFATTLPISRWQRDLTDSTVLRNLGVAIGHHMLAVESTLKGLGKLELDAQQLQHDLEQNWEVLAEPIQTVMRRYGLKKPYEQLKALTHGTRGIDRESLRDFITALEIPQVAKQQLLAMTPADYTGWAARGAQYHTPQN